MSNLQVDVERKGGNMENQQKKGIIAKMFDWTLAIIALLTIIGLAWKFILNPLFLG